MAACVAEAPEASWPRVLQGASESQHRENPDRKSLKASRTTHLNAAHVEGGSELSAPAGDKAVELSAYREARRILTNSHCRRSTHLPQDQRAYRDQGIDIRLKLRPIFGATAEYDRTGSTASPRPRRWPLSIEDRPRLAAINVAQTLVHNWRGELDASIEMRRTRARHCPRNRRAARLELPASFYLAQAYMWRGDFRQLARAA